MYFYFRFKGFVQSFRFQKYPYSLEKDPTLNSTIPDISDKYTLGLPPFFLQNFHQDMKHLTIY